LGVVFFWFGVLKFFPGVSVAENLAGRTIYTLTWGAAAPMVAVPVLAGWECAIGVGLLTGRFMGLTLTLLALQLSGTFMPLVFFPSETWTHFPYAPTLEGQYILKNIVLVTAGLLLEGTRCGGRVVAAPTEAQQSVAPDQQRQRLATMPSSRLPETVIHSDRGSASPIVNQPDLHKDACG
jgi:hypothetical protein